MTIFRMRLGVALLVMTFAFAQEEQSDALGEQAEADLPKMVRVQVEFIEVPHETMTALLAEPREATNDTPLRAKLQELVKEGKAKILETQMVTARSGDKAIMESIQEFIFPIEFDPPEVPSDIPTGSERPESPRQADPRNPVAWETHNLGSTLEIEPHIAEDDKFVDLRVYPRIGYFSGNKVWHEETIGKNTLKFQMPDIYIIKSETAMTLIAGQPFLMTTFSPKNEKGEADFTKKVLIFVRADVLTVVAE